MDSGLSEFANSLRDYTRRAQDRPLDHIRWLPAQDRFHRCPARVKMLRAGNQSQGKTTAALAEVVWRALGAHPYLTTPKPPIEAVILTASWSQGISIQGKFHDLLPAGCLDPSVEFDRVRGFRGRNPAALFRNGSIVRFKTTSQSSLDLAGSTLSVALFDEPPSSPRHFQEILRRLTRAGDQAVLLLSLTPINAPTDYLRELVESKGQIADIHSPLTPEAMIPIGGTGEPLRLDDGTECNAEWISNLRASCLAMEEPVVVDGEWEQRVSGRVFTAWDTTIHVNRSRPRGSAQVSIGIDHGSKIGKQVAVLVAVQGARGSERVWILDETIGGARSSTRDDARDLLSMLERNSIRFADLDWAWGDRLHLSGSVDRKGNRDLLHAVAQELGVRHDTIRPQIRTVKRRGTGRGSVAVGCRWLHQAMLREGGFTVNPRCDRVIECVNRWDYRDTDFKDPIDAIRYAVNHRIFNTKYQVAKPTIKLG